MKLCEYYKEEFKTNYSKLKNKETRNSQIPNILTLSRLLSPIIIIPLVISGNLKIALIFIILFALTDLLDGYIARKYNYVTNLGIEIDPICDKVFLSSLLIPLILVKNQLIIPVIFEALISITGIINKRKQYNTKVNIFGKTKTAFTYILISYSYLSLFFKTNRILFNILFYITISLQFITFISYLKRYINKEENKNYIKEETEVGYRIFKFFLMPLFKLIYNPKIKGEENIPKTGPIVICCNHKHVYDQLLAIMGTKRVVHYMAKKEYFDSKFAWFFRITGCISVDRQVKHNGSLEKAITILKHNGAVGIFPEGTRNKTDAILLPLKMGAVKMAAETDAYIVPIGLSGDYVKRSKNLNAVIGKPFKVNKDDLEKENEILAKKIISLMEESKTIRKK